MSINICISAKRTIIVKKTGKESTQTVRFDCIQTPTAITYQLLAAPDPIKAYEEWVLSISKDEEEDVYEDEDDFMCDNPRIIGKRTCNYCKEHLMLLKTWVSEIEADGYDIEVFDL